MCNDYTREIEIGRVMKLIKEMDQLPPMSWAGGKTPNDIAPQPHIKISDHGFVARLDGKQLTGEMMKWAWNTPQGKPVFNFVSEKRDFSKTDRVLILATGFYEYTKSEAPKVKLKDQHFFKMKGDEWFWIAGIVRHNCFTMLTTKPGADIKPYHDRQVCVVAPDDGLKWVRDADNSVLQPLPKGTLEVITTRKDGEVLTGAG
jgi:putative SOS response-associated peptidase YedK